MADNLDIFDFVILRQLELTALVGGNEAINPFVATETYHRQADGGWKLISFVCTHIPKRVLWEASLRVMAKTALGRLCVADHCKNAVDEMRGLDEAVMELFSQVPGTPHPVWDALRAAMPSWDVLG